jgi:hypothetical protein
MDESTILEHSVAEMLGRALQDLRKRYCGLRVLGHPR